MSEILDELKYTNDHEWAKESEDVVIIGITDYAQDALGEIVYIELPTPGDKITKGETFGAVESTKSVSDLYAPISGEVVEVNEALYSTPEQINADPYGDGWIVKISPTDMEELEDLLTHEEYAELLESEE